jgi:Mrp family chromosome partitioning ATPase
MSWFYEALLRAEKERPKSIESLPSIAAEGSQSKPEVPSSESFSGIHGEAGKSPNGFRHLTLPRSEACRLVFQTDPHGVPAEQFRLLRQTLRQEFPAGAVLMITSPGAGDGKTLTSLNLSACLASSGDATLLVEADVRRPTARNIWGGAIEPPGIEDAWAGKVEPRKTIHLIDELSLHTASVARIPDNPVLPAADVAELLPLADGALLVIRAQRTPRELSRRAFEMLGARLHGVIFNAATVDSNPYYGYLG